MEKYLDKSLSFEERAQDLCARMTQDEKASQRSYTSAPVPRLGIPAYNWWNEALHGVARGGVATVFPQAIGLAAMFKSRIKNQQLALVLGIAVTFLIRLACHYISGVAVWEVLWPNELGWAAPIWSISYNASYMVPEIVITGIVAALSYRPLEKYYQGEDLR